MNICEWRGADIGDQLHISPARILIPEAVGPPRHGPRGHRAPGKPDWGLWTSTLLPGPTSDWVSWCRSEEFGDPDALNWHVLTPNPDARLLVIDSLAHFVATVRTFPGRSLPLDIPGVPMRWGIDFEAVFATGFDAVHLSDRGNGECHLARGLPGDIDTIGLYGWDVESTVWLRWVFDSQSRIIRSDSSAAASSSAAIVLASDGE